MAEIQLFLHLNCIDVNIRCDKIHARAFYLIQVDLRHLKLVTVAQRLYGLVDEGDAGRFYGGGARVRILPPAHVIVKAVADLDDIAVGVDAEADELVVWFGW